MISNTELDRRWKLVREVMRKHSLDWVIGTTGHPFGYQRWLTNRTGLAATLAAVPLSGEVILASHGDHIHSTPRDSYGVKHIVSCAQPNLLGNNHVPALLEVIRGSSVRRIGLLGLGYLPAATYLALQQGLPGVELVDATDWIAPIKAVKSEEELVCMRRAAALHDDAVQRLREVVRPGVSGHDVLNIIRADLMAAGSAHQTMMAGSAPPGEVAKYFTGGDRKMNKGDQFVILIEGSEPDGYYSEVMPTICLGAVPDELRRVFDDVVEIQERLAEAARPGTDPNDLLRLNDELMARKGYPPEARLLGHSQGVDLVERPAMTPKGENFPLQANMVMSIHPTTHAPTAWGYPPSISFLIKEDGFERMLRVPQEIICL